MKKVTAWTAGAVLLLLLMTNLALSATDRVDSIRVTVRSGSHTISTASFPNGVWFILTGGVRETVKTFPPFPDVPPGMTTTLTFNLLSNPDSVIGANFDMSMDAVPHGGQNLYTGSLWDSPTIGHLNRLGDLIGHIPNDADIMFQLVLLNAPLTKVSPPGAVVRMSSSVDIKIKANGAPGQMINASSDNPAIAVTPSATTGADSTATFTARWASGRGGQANLTFSHGANTLVVPAEIAAVPALTPLGTSIFVLLLAGTAAYYLLRRRRATA